MESDLFEGVDEMEKSQFLGNFFHWMRNVFMQVKRADVTPLVEKDEATPHGFRATARTLMVEQLGIRTDLIEHQLAHAVRDATGEAYNRTRFLPERREMMQVWADYLHEIQHERDRHTSRVSIFSAR